jgi:hypothetical protein
MDFDKVLALIDAMNREGVEYITFGAVALAAHGLVRATEDADFFINPTAENIERLKRALRSIWDDPNIDEISAAELSGDYPAVAYWPAGEDFGSIFSPAWEKRMRTKRSNGRTARSAAARSAW